MVIWQNKEHMRGWIKMVKIVKIISAKDKLKEKEKDKESKEEKTEVPMVV